MVEFICPYCRYKLKCEKEAYICQMCGRKFEFKDGIYDFTGEDWTWLGDSFNIKELLKFSHKYGFAKAKALFKKKHTYIFDEKRADWLFHCINFKESKRCLDIGSGFGSIAFSLAKWYDEVWSLERSNVRLEFQKLRRQEEGANVLLVKSDMLNLPFPDSFFDLVCLNGVLEWAGLSEPFKNPTNTQMKLLLEINRVLRNSGCLFIGIENRFGISYLIGAIDHEGLPFTSILPRPLSNLVVRILKRRRYLTYTYSYLGYKKLLRKAGFNYIKIYWVKPGYHYPIFSGAIDDVESFRLYLRIAGKKRAFYKIIYNILSVRILGRFILRFFFPEFLIFAYKKRNEGLEFTLMKEKGAKSFLRCSKGDAINYYILDEKNQKIISIVRFPRK